MNSQLKYKLSFLAIMCFFGCLAPVVRAIGLPAAVIACLRAWIASLSLILFFFVTGKKITKEEIKKYALPLFFCGIGIAGDWLCLFESYNLTTVATATVCYYVSPILVVAATPIFLKEKLSVKQTVCIAAAFCGIALVSGVVETGLPNLSEISGVLFSLGGALFYAMIVIINKKYMQGIDPLFSTTAQLLVAAFATTPYILLKEDLGSLHSTAKTVLLLLLLGVVMTAMAYIVYFANIVRIPTQTAAIFSYGDPTVAVAVSAIFLKEPISLFGILGSLLVIGSALVAELQFSKKEKT